MQLRSPDKGRLSSDLGLAVCTHWWPCKSSFSEGCWLICTERRGCCPREYCGEELERKNLCNVFKKLLSTNIYRNLQVLSEDFRSFSVSVGDWWGAYSPHFPLDFSLWSSFIKSGQRSKFQPSGKTQFGLDWARCHFSDRMLSESKGLSELFLSSLYKQFLFFSIQWCLNGSPALPCPKS